MICKIGHHTGTRGWGCQLYRYTQKACSARDKQSVDHAIPGMIWAPTKQCQSPWPHLGCVHLALPAQLLATYSTRQQCCHTSSHGIVFPCCMLAVSQWCSVHCCTKLAVVSGCWCLPLVLDSGIVQWTAVGPPVATAQTGLHLQLHCLDTWWWS